MEGKVKIFGHPPHPMLIVFPLGLLATAVIFDVISLFANTPYLFSAAYWMIAAGLISGVLAAVFGLIDWLAIPNATRAKAIGLWHGAGNGIVIVLFAVSWFLRRSSPQNPSGAALTFSFIGVVIALVTAWMGGELVDRLGVGVDDGANLNSPNSLSHRPASSNNRDGNVRRAA